MTIVTVAASDAGRSGIAAVRAMLAERAQSADTPLSERRQRMEEFAAAAPAVMSVEIEEGVLDGRRVLRAVPPQPIGDTLFLHGGAYVLGSATTHIKLAARYAAVSNLTFTVLDYRLAPEHRYPAALDDVLAAWSVLATPGRRVALAGDSAGGGLALAAAIAIRDRGLVAPAILGLVAPWIDLTMAGDSMTRNAPHDPMLSRAGLIADADRYRGKVPAGDPRISPLFADLAGLPPLFVQVGGNEVLLDDTLRLHARAEAAGVTCEVELWAEMTHAFGAFGAMVPEAGESIRHFGSALSAGVGRSRG